MGRDHITTGSGIVGQHVLFLTHYFPPEVNAPASRTYEHAKRWARKGLHITVITNHPHHPHGKLFPGYKNRFYSLEQLDGMNVIRVKTFLTPNAGFSRRIINYIIYAAFALIAAIRIKRFDVLIATSPQFFCGLAGAMVCRLLKKKFVLEIRDLWPDSIIELGVLKKGSVLNLLHILEKWMYSMADTIIITSEEFKKQIEKTGYPSGSIYTVANSVDLEIFKYRGNRIRRKTVVNNDFIVCYTGTFGMAQGLDVLLDTAKLLEEQKEIHFLLIGDGAERKRILERVHEMNLGNLTILPLQSKQKIVQYIADADIGLIPLKDLPIFQTAVPSKIFEYAALKKPIILSTVKGEGAHLLEKYDFGLVTAPEDSASLREAILKLYNNRNLRKRFGENGYQVVQRLFNRDVMAEKMLRVILSNHGSARSISSVSARQV